MKKITLIILACFMVSLTAFAIPKPKKNTGSVVGVFQVKMNSSFYEVKKGTYKDGIQVTIYNPDTKKKYTTYTQPGGYFYFLNLEPGTYVVYYWEIERQGGNSRTTYPQVIDDRTIKFTIKPEVVTIAGYIKSEVTFANEIQEYSQGGTFDVEASQKSKVQKTEKQAAKMVEYFQKLDKRKKWKGYSYE